VIEADRDSQTIVVPDEGWEQNLAHRRARRRSHAFAGSLPEASAAVSERPFMSAEDLVAVRAFVNDWASLEQLAPERTGQLVLAVNELATNSIRYGGGTGWLRVWREADTLLCEISDSGVIRDPLAGRRQPPPDERSGRGLWLVNQLCDLVQIRSSSQAGTTVRVHMSLTN
jgi:anti-sigma regulatory factor (Ser/Thr protein kinase)